MQNLNLRGLISFKKHSFKNRYGKYFSLGPILHPLDKCFAPMLPFKTPYFGFISITLSTSNCSTSDCRALRFAQPSLLILALQFALGYLVGCLRGP